MKRDYERTQKALAKAQSDLEEREQKIQGLEIDLDEVRDRLDTAHQQIEEHETEKQGLLSRRDMEGSVYEAKDQQIKAIKDERDNLQKQLDSQIGQYKMATDRADDFRKRLHQEREKNDALRSRQGWSALQEEKKAADEALEAHKKASAEESERARVEKDEVLEHRQKLEIELDILKSELLSARNATTAAIATSETEKQDKEQLMQEKLQLQEEVDRLQKDRQRIQDALASVSNEQNKSMAEPGMLGTVPNGTSSPDATLISTAVDYHEDYSDHAMSYDRAPPLPPKELFLGPTMGSLPRKAVNSPPGQPTSSSASPRSYPLTPGSELGSPTSPPWGPSIPGQSTTNGFKTIHGHHRPDGALGGYAEGRGIRRKQSGTYDSLYESSIRRGAGGSDSAHSEAGSGEMVEAEEARVAQAPSQMRPVERRSIFPRKFSSKS